jgi:SAM-dependent methyltransferase
VKKAIKDWVREQNGKRNILDAGSGFGQYTYFLSGLNKSWFVNAVDVKAEQIADCNQFFSRISRSNVIFEMGDLTTFVKPDTFDLILSVDVMEHILEDEKVFVNFYDSLTNNGMLLISTPSDQGGSDVHEHEEDSSFIDEHVRDGYNIDEIQEKLRNAGFSKTEARYAYGKPGQAGWRLSMKYPILMLNASKLFFIILPFYYLLTFPIALVFNYFDLYRNHKTGTGLIVKAWK